MFSAKIIRQRYHKRFELSECGEWKKIEWKLRKTNESEYLQCYTRSFGIETVKCDFRLTLSIMQIRMKTFFFASRRLIHKNINKTIRFFAKKF